MSGSPNSLGSGIQELTSKPKPTCQETDTVCKTNFAVGKLPNRRQSLGSRQKHSSTMPIADSTLTSAPFTCIVNASDIPYCGEDPKMTAIGLSKDIQNKVKLLKKSKKIKTFSKQRVLLNGG